MLTIQWDGGSTSDATIMSLLLPLILSFAEFNFSNTTEQIDFQIKIQQDAQSTIQKFTSSRSTINILKP